MSGLIPYVHWTIPDTSPQKSGRFYISSESPEKIFSEHREAISKAYGITERMPFYSFLWNRLWMDSPLSHEKMNALRAAFVEFHPNRSEESEMHAFLGALDTCLRNGFELGVSLSPPGHADLGVTTIFPHCPKCKLVNEWTFSAPLDDSARRCELCGTEFRPSATYSRQLWERPKDNKSTEKVRRILP